MKYGDLQERTRESPMRKSGRNLGASGDYTHSLARRHWCASDRRAFLFFRSVYATKTECFPACVSLSRIRKEAYAYIRIRIRIPIE